MVKKEIKYIDYDDNERSEVFYFNLSKAEIAEMQLSQAGGLSQSLKTIIDSKDNAKIVETFKGLILKSYGVKSPDGKRFIKNKEILDEFVQSEAYVELFMELATNTDAAIAFVNGILPKEM